jgi:hypothetical protein
MAFLGMRGTGDWATDERPLNWRQGILKLYPNGDAPLTAILSKMGNEVTTDPQFHWWTKNLASQGGAVTGVYTNAGLSVAYVSGGAVGDTLYVKMAELTASEFRTGHQVLLRDASHLDVDVNAKAVAVVLNGASSYVACKLLEADDNGATTDLSDCDAILIIGNINAEGGPIPDAIAYDPDKWYNYSQIFRNALEITGTAKETILRTTVSYMEKKREALQYHSIEMERAFIFGVRTENVGANGKKERTTMGIINAIKEGAPTNVANYKLDTTYSGDSWLTSGEEWLDSKLEQIFRYGASEKLAFAGSGAILGINRLAKSTGQIQLMPMTTDYGIKVMHWVTPFGDLYLKRHPLFSYDTVTRNSMLIVEMSELKYRYIRNRDTKFIPMSGEVSGGGERIDGTVEEWLTECGLEIHHPLKHAWLSGFNENNTV